MDFRFFNGNQGDGSVGQADTYAWAVRDGDVGAVPVPAAVWLFGSALGLMGAIRRETKTQI